MAPKDLVFEDVRVGEELGSFEYLLTEAKMDYYKDVVKYADACFLIAAKDYLKVLHMAYEPRIGLNARIEAEYYNPPKIGKRIRVVGKMVDKYVKRDHQFIVVEADSVDEDGVHIMRNRAYFRFGAK